VREVTQSPTTLDGAYFAMHYCMPIGQFVKK